MAQRFMLLQEAATYCGMSKTLFAELVRPHVTPVRIYKPRGKDCGQQVLHYDRIDLDKWCDEFKQKQLSADQEQSNNTSREKRPTSTKGVSPWAVNLKGSSCEATSGTSTKSTGVTQFASVLSKVRGGKRKGS